MSEFKKYEALRDQGSSSLEVYRIAISDQVGRIGAFRLIRAVFNLDVVEAKDVVARAEGSGSLGELQGELEKALHAELEEETSGQRQR
jgi:hypothetical protein